MKNEVDDIVGRRESLENVIFRFIGESSKFNYFWMPDQVRHDGFGTFYEFINGEPLTPTHEKGVYY